MTPQPPDLRAVLERAQRAGMLGPGDVAVAASQSLEFFAKVPVSPAAKCVDLGSGGGVPGLPLALAFPETSWVLVDAWEARCTHLRRAVRDLALRSRVSVTHGRAEEIGRTELRSSADVVVARSFGPPAWTAECAAPLLTPGGILVVSVARDDSPWPDRVPELGLALAGAWSASGGSYRSYARVDAVGDRYPRRPAAQRRAPLF